ncbi:hypothetical protein BDU57DRAFT_536860 [Ampelomyces quisqualis]|uniref:Uncharacterized protein n=1 Tax=Ampelomyces quisqualis TaxID=50730 RepID=A0A6A5QZ28_AMPQU|nr:hypothetical protein BDU57DRAFT_536860 [Ampelomyces quisqualis]
MSLLMPEFAKYLNLTISKSGKPEEPNNDTLEVNLSIVMNTANTLAPSWTATQGLPDLKGLLSAVSQSGQSPSVVARVVAFSMASQSGHGDMIVVSDGRGKYTEIEKSVLGPAYDSMRDKSLSNDEVIRQILALGSQITSNQ